MEKLPYFCYTVGVDCRLKFTQISYLLVTKSMQSTTWPKYKSNEQSGGIQPVQLLLLFQEDYLLFRDVFANVLFLCHIENCTVF